MHQRREPKESQPYTYRPPLQKSFVINKTLGKDLLNQLRIITVCPWSYLFFCEIIARTHHGKAAGGGRPYGATRGTEIHVYES